MRLCAPYCLEGMTSGTPGFFFAAGGDEGAPRNVVGWDNAGRSGFVTPMFL